MKPSIKFLYSDHEIYDSDEPALYDPTQYPEVEYVLSHYNTIHAEVNDYINGKFDIEYVNPGAPQMTYPDSWKNIYFKNYLLKYDLGKKHFPGVYDILNNNPHITLAGITTLAPHSRLKPHCGETNAIIRCHLGLKIPGALPELGLKVNGQSVGWKEGGVFAFNDAYRHEAWNETDQYRYVLVFDFIRPEFARYRTWICAYCLGIEAMRYLLEWVGLYNKTPLFIRSLLSKPLAVILWVYLKITGN